MVKGIGRERWLETGCVNSPFTILIHGENLFLLAYRIVKSEHIDVVLHEAGQGQFLEQAGHVLLGVGADNGPHLRVVEGKGVVDQFAFPEKSVDFGTLVGDEAQKIFR